MKILNLDLTVFLGLTSARMMLIPINFKNPVLIAYEKNALHSEITSSIQIP